MMFNFPFSFPIMIRLPSLLSLAVLLLFTTLIVILIPPILILVSRLFPTLAPTPYRAYFIQASTTHRRLLPCPSQLSFTYPLLYIGADVDSLEQGLCNLPFRILRYGTHKALICLKGETYLRGSGSLRERVEKLVSEAELGIEKDDVGKIWLITMPRLFGYGINALSIWYIYEKRKKMDVEDDENTPLLCLLLEVDNTVGEKHAYILRVNGDFSQPPAQGFDYAWTFPRSFQVSPFNSRDGFYTLDLVNPFPQKSTTSNSISTTTHTTNPPVKIVLRVLSNDKRCKLHTTLTSSRTNLAIPLHTHNIIHILATLARYPFTIFLTLPRVLYQASRLLYTSRLAIYTRPEPVDFSKGAREKDSSWNKPEHDPIGVGFNLKMNEKSGFEKCAERLVRKWALYRAKEVAIDLVLYSRDQLIFSTQDSKETTKRPFVEMKTKDSRFFAHLLSAPSAEHYLLLAPEYQTEISSSRLFAIFFFPPQHDPFTPPPSPDGSTPSDSLSLSQYISKYQTSLLQQIRLSHLRWYFQHSQSTPPSHLLSPSATQSIDRYQPITILFILSRLFCADWFEDLVMNRFLKSIAVYRRDSSKIWERAIARYGGIEQTEWDNLGSVRY